jgi:hypothetical protein
MKGKGSFSERQKQFL